jgi:hypothetical protein
VIDAILGFIGGFVVGGAVVFWFANKVICELERGPKK